jgi:hypothetical protein
MNVDTLVVAWHGRAVMRVGICASLVWVLFAMLPTAAQADAAARLDSQSSDVLVSMLKYEAEQAHTWRLTWTVINSGLTALSFGGLWVLPKSQRYDLILGGAVSAASSAVTWFWPLDVEDDARIAARLQALPVAERQARLQALIAHSAEDEASRMAWPWHVGNFVSALLPAAAVWFLFHHRQEAILSLFSSFASGEVELLTQPTGLIRWRASAPVAFFSVDVGRQHAIFTCRAAW